MQLNDLIITFNLDGKSGKLHENLVMTAYHGEDMVFCIVPKGFNTDFASIPRVVRSMIPQLGTWTAAAVVHDYYYWCGMPRKQADDIFYQMMMDAKTKWWYREAIYKAVRTFGGLAYAKHRKLKHDATNAVVKEEEEG